MAKTRAQLQELVTELDAAMPQLIADHRRNDEFWAAFAGQADVVQDGAGADDNDWVQEQIDAVLRKHGKPVLADQSPSDNWPAES